MRYKPEQLDSSREIVAYENVGKHRCIIWDGLFAVNNKKGIINTVMVNKEWVGLRCIRKRIANPRMEELKTSEEGANSLLQGHPLRNLSQKSFPRQSDQSQTSKKTLSQVQITKGIIKVTFNPTTFH
ncbi:MAG TPA: hypothetical protein VF350_05460 [Candidatus Bathyarchaeia archaeon]